jgi:hypothetical protein
LSICFDVSTLTASRTTLRPTPSERASSGSVGKLVPGW